MTSPSPDPAPRHVLVYAPLGRDAQLIAAALAASRIEATIAIDIDECRDAILGPPNGPSAAIITEEAFRAPGQGPTAARIIQALATQPVWSDFPLIILIGRPGLARADAPDAAHFIAQFQSAGSVTFLERPVGRATLAGAVFAALRARFRQHQARLLLEERGQREAEIRRVNDQLRALNSELEGARDAAVSASLAKSRFLANMSHEFRTPLNAIIGYAEMLAEEIASGDAVTPEDFQKIRSAGRHLLKLVNDVLDLAKIEAGRMEVFASSFAVRYLVREVADTMRASVERNGNEFSVAYAGDAAAATMCSDELKIRQVLVNLLSNAAKFTQDGKVTLAISLRRVVRGAVPSICLQVSDTGIGLSREDINSLFRDFHQVDSSATRRFEGTGLGLSLTRQFCQMLGGDIHVMSEIGKGSTFTVTLPLDISAQATLSTCAAELATE